ncbi:MAG: NAD-dependent epimerase/dehydratase family protein [Bdellovibrionales bacterium]|nr:NAD-dependent epimerase/dehydratase family protein [Bdellovibrionales bacterium]
MSQKTVFISGANGEVGHGLIKYLSDHGGYRIVALDIQPLDKELASRCDTVIEKSILDERAIEDLGAKFEFDVIFHLAGLLSTGSEKSPLKGHQLNVNGSVSLLELAAKQSRSRLKPVIFMFPSTIAVYGLGSLDEKMRAGAVRETENLTPVTMYGANKLYIESLGRYYSEHYQLLTAEADLPKLDFRAIRFPGIISAETMPSSGTSDYCPEMLHAAAKNEAYECFVREDAAISFMVMPDAVRSLIELSEADAAKLSQRVYNISAFSLTAGEIKSEILKYFPEANITFRGNGPRQFIIDTWPVDVDQSKARSDWGWKAAYDLNRSFEEYLVPGVISRYGLNDFKKKCANC